MADDISKMGDWFKRASVKTIDKVQRALISGGNAIQLKARKLAPRNTGLLRKSIIKTSNFVFGEFSVTVGPTVNYGAHVEFGTKAHFPPIAPLKRWAKLHGMDEGAAWAIAKKMSKEGTKPRPYLIPAFNQVKPKVVRKIQQIVRDA